jgi:hypothetical protein
MPLPYDTVTMAGVSDRPRVIPFRYSSLCLAYTVCASILFLFAPLVTPDSVGTADPHRISLLAANGWRVGILLSLPVVFALVPVLRRRSAHIRTEQTAAALLLIVYMIGGITSIGLYYAPSAALMVAAAVRERPPLQGSAAAGYRPDPAPPPSASGQG